MQLKLKAYLANIGMTLKEFGEIVESNPHYLSQISSGQVKPSKKLARRIEKATEGNVKVEISERGAGGIKRKTTTATPF